MIKYLIKFYQCYFNISQCFIKYYKTLRLIIVNLIQLIESRIILIIQHLAVNENQNFI